VYDLWWRI